MPWYYFYSNKESKYKDETFYNTNSFSFSNLLELNYSNIQSEIISFLKSNEVLLTPYFNDSIVNQPNKWKTLSFYFWGIPVSAKAIKFCPKTIAILNKIPNILSASISVLEPNTEIKAHYGDTDAIFRCHFGIEIPSKLPQCGFRVGFEDRAWEKGKLLIFNDSAYHKGYNYTDKRRIILLFDVLRPEFKSKKKWICAMIRGHLFFQMLLIYFPTLKNKKNNITKSMSVFFAIIVYIKLLFHKDVIK